MYKDFLFSTSLPTFVILCLVGNSQCYWVRYLIVILICFSLIISDADYFFIYVAICKLFLWKISASVTSHFLVGIVLFCLSLSFYVSLNTTFLLVTSEYDKTWVSSYLLKSSPSSPSGWKASSSVHCLKRPNYDRNSTWPCRIPRRPES